MQKGQFGRFGAAAVWLAAAAFAVPAAAHEFWIAPISAVAKPGDAAEVRLLVGEHFEGELVGFSKAQTAGFSHHFSAGRQDLAALVPVNPVAAVPVPLGSPGTHLLAFESQPNSITLAPDAFHAYLHEEGLDAIKTARETAGKAAEPGRERYRRFIKTLVQVGNAPASRQDTRHAVVTGQRLEIIPLANPLGLRPGQNLGVKVLFEGKPLQGALVKAWHKGSGERSGQTLVIRSRSAADGTSTFNLPYAGAWMISLVHMVPTTGEAALDWDSLWGNLSFVLPAHR